jgi:hypothetical protein
MTPYEIQQQQIQAVRKGHGSERPAWIHTNDYEESEEGSDERDELEEEEGQIQGVNVKREV